MDTAADSLDLAMHLKNSINGCRAAHLSQSRDGRLIVFLVLARHLCQLDERGNGRFVADFPGHRYQFQFALLQLLENKARGDIAKRLQSDNDQGMRMPAIGLHKRLNRSRVAYLPEHTGRRGDLEPVARTNNAYEHGNS